MTSRELEALEHIERNGSLLWMPCSGWEAQQLFKKLEREGRIERNPWSGDWHVRKDRQPR